MNKMNNFTLICIMLITAIIFVVLMMFFERYIVSTANKQLIMNSASTLINDDACALNVKTNANNKNNCFISTPFFSLMYNNTLI